MRALGVYHSQPRTPKTHTALHSPKPKSKGPLDFPPFAHARPAWEYTDTVQCILCHMHMHTNTSSHIRKYSAHTMHNSSCLCFVLRITHTKHYSRGGGGGNGQGMVRWYYPSMILTGILFCRRSRPSPHTTKPRLGGCHVPWAATLLVRSRLLDGVGGPYFGSVRVFDPLLTPATRDTVIRIFGYD